jgi:hypothetical protein
MSGGSVQLANPLNLDDVVAVSRLIERVVGRSLTPDESSRLKCAYQAVQAQRGGATLQAIVGAFPAHEGDSC